MDKLLARLPHGSHDSVAKNDIFSQVIGLDPPGRVRMYGLGVSPSDLWGNVPSKNACRRLILQQKNLMSEMNDKFAGQEQQLQDQAKQLQDQAKELRA